MTYTGKPGIDHVEVGKTYWVKNGAWPFTVLSIDGDTVKIRHALGESTFSKAAARTDRSPIWIEDYEGQ